MSWQEYYQQRLLSADAASRKIQSGNRVLFGHAAAEPTIVKDAMLANKDLYSDVEIVHMVSYGAMEYCRPGMEKHFRHNAMFASGHKTRAAFQEGRVDFTPTYLSQIPVLIKEDLLPIDVFILQIAPPDKHGYVNLGTSIDYGLAAVSKAGLVIAEVNENMPHSMGSSFIPVTEFDYFVEHTAPLPELVPPVITDVEKQIGRHISSLVHDGDTLQLGIGSLPDAALLFLKDKNDLGIHSEMVSDGVMHLMQAKVVTNKRKTLFPDKAVVTFFAGSKGFYDFVDYNPAFQTMPADWVNNPCNIALNDNMVSINSCVSVDFYGQISSESIGKLQISGVGGQVDFIRGANMSKNGRAIIAMASTTKNDAESKIVPFFGEGTPVTTSRFDSRYIVTEYGIAFMRGKTIRDRARALIAIAHPKFRPHLIEEWEKFFGAKYKEA